jgi:hypothetical protein
MRTTPVCPLNTTQRTTHGVKVKMHPLFVSGLSSFNRNVKVRDITVVVCGYRYVSRKENIVAKSDTILAVLLVRANTVISPTVCYLWRGLPQHWLLGLTNYKIWEISRVHLYA